MRRCSSVCTVKGELEKNLKLKVKQEAEKELDFTCRLKWSQRLRWITVCCCPLSSCRKYYKRLKQSFTQFWAVMMITRNTIKRRHWRKVDKRKEVIPAPCPWLGFLATVCLLTLLCYKSLCHMSYTIPAALHNSVRVKICPRPLSDNAVTSMFGVNVQFLLGSPVFVIFSQLQLQL